MIVQGKHGAVRKAFLPMGLARPVTTFAVAGAAAMGVIGFTAPAAQAHNVWDRVAAC